jgi:hypothetical protein
MKLSTEKYYFIYEFITIFDDVSQLIQPSDETYTGNTSKL